jgi:hypothetical protein
MRASLRAREEGRREGGKEGGRGGFSTLTGGSRLASTDGREAAAGAWEDGGGGGVGAVKRFAKRFREGGTEAVGNDREASGSTGMSRCGDPLRTWGGRGSSREWWCLETSG